MKKLLLALAVCAMLPLVALADSPLATYSGSLAATGTSVPLSLAGQSTCAVVLSGTWTGTATFQGSGDNGATWNTVTNINAGTATANGTYGGNIAPYLTRFRVSWARSTGTLVYFEACSATVSANGGLGPNPVFTGSVVGNAGAATPSPAPTGFYGPFVVAQATAVPTPQLGNIGIGGSVQVSGASPSFPGGYANCPGFLAVCAPTLMVGNTYRISAGAVSNITGTLPFTSPTHAIACSSTSDLPCVATGTCSLSATTTCNFTTSVPASSNCDATRNNSDTTTGVSSWKVSLTTTTLTVTVTTAASQTTTAAVNVHCL